MSADFEYSEDSFLPETRLSSEVHRGLVALAERQMLAPARKAGYELQLVGATVLPQHQVITRTVRGTWLFVNHLDDPTAKQFGGRLPIPSDQLARLTELDRHGVFPEHVWVGHQLPDSYREGTSLPPLVPSPPELRELEERLKLSLDVGFKLYLKALFAFLAGAGMAPLAAAGVLAGGVGLDPIVFGGVAHPQRPTIVQWCALAQWEWE